MLIEVALLTVGNLVKDSFIIKLIFDLKHAQVLDMDCQ